MAQSRFRAKPMKCTALPFWVTNLQSQKVNQYQGGEQVKLYDGDKLDGFEQRYARINQQFNDALALSEKSKTLTINERGIMARMNAAERDKRIREVDALVNQYTAEA